MKVLVIGASKEELSPFRKAGFDTAAVGSGLTFAGVGSARAIGEFSPDVVVEVGSAGTFSNRLELGSVHSFSFVMNRDHDLELYHLKRGAMIAPDGRTISDLPLLGPEPLRLVSSSAFATGAFGSADAADMEAYSVAYAASMASKPCAVFKLITDNVGQRVLISDYKRFLREGRELLLEAVVSFISGYGS